MKGNLLLKYIVLYNFIYNIQNNFLVTEFFLLKMTSKIRNSYYYEHESRNSFLHPKIEFSNKKNVKI